MQAFIKKIKATPELWGEEEVVFESGKCLGDLRIRCGTDVYRFEEKQGYLFVSLVTSDGVMSSIKVRPWSGNVIALKGDHE